MYEFLDHTADIAVRVWGKDLPSLFVNAAKAMAEYLEGFLSPLEGRGNSELIELSGPDQNALLVAWLSEILYRTHTGRKIYTEFAITELTDKSLRAQIAGQKAQKFSKDIKAVTYHGLEIKKVEQGYEATITFDV